MKKYLTIAIIAILASTVNLAIAQNVEYDKETNTTQNEMNNREIQSGLQSLTLGIGKMLQGKAMVEKADTADNDELRNSLRVVGSDMINEGNQMIQNGIDQITRGKDMLMQNISTSTQMMNN